MKIAINAQLAKGTGGIKQFIIGLVNSLGRLNDGDERYIIVTSYKYPDWLDKYIGPNQTIIVKPDPEQKFSQKLKKLLGPIRRPAGKIWRQSKTLIMGNSKSRLPESNGFFESLGADIIHFPFQSYYRCTIPTVFNPHDLQHLYFPEFFTQENINYREELYKNGCQLSTAVAALSYWVKKDISEQYRIDPNKIFSIPIGSPTEFYNEISRESIESVRIKYDLPDRFMFYPAKNWPHKNHLNLLKAIKLLEKNDVEPFLVCSGILTDHWPIIEGEIKRIGLENQVKFLGFIETVELRSLYHLAEFLIFPSLFEGGGFPVVEALYEGTPVVCSNVTSLPEYGGDAALYFDPKSVKNIANAIKKMWTSEKLREEFRKKGGKQIKHFNWEKTAKTYRAIYRKVGGKHLSSEDVELLRSALDSSYKCLPVRQTGNN